MKTGYVYILCCRDGSYYTGVTNDIQARLHEHNAGMQTGFTHSRRPVSLAWSSMELPILDAISLEKQIKGWRREKKEALIEGRYYELPGLSRTSQ